ncbi:C40 family peptidase [Neorhodopirellula pilleata]|uniref:Uncharacterized protein n=1 Tax=Neorhodopirellula pilleata TaxID=2714738 RepID=A0A5C5ZV34_9BACT|nr:hypothetical protein [Neorhodopirellula pilleata]TWT91402.1 hypothetical protein Pla100_52520 [Neorhodopirellula pilleata]TWT91451.1 hypothetical protein Pla100_53010 [Neorhodopirellula pilleata]
MFRMILLVASLAIASTCNAQSVPDGTLVFSNKKGIVGRVARRITGGDRYTHVGIVFDGYVYESDWPRSKRTPVQSYGKPGSTNDYYAPSTPIDRDRLAAMRSQANATLGTPYRLRGYFRPGVTSAGTWCSPYVGRILAAGGSSLSNHDRHEPQNLLRRVGGDHRLSSRVRR